MTDARRLVCGNDHGADRTGSCKERDAERNHRHGIPFGGFRSLIGGLADAAFPGLQHRYCHQQKQDSTCNKE